MFLVSLLLALLCYEPVRLETTRNVSQLTDIKEVVVNPDRDRSNEFLFFLYVETNAFFDSSHVIGSRKEIQCGEILNITDPISHKPRVFLDIRSEGADYWKTIVGIEIPGEPLQCKSILGLGPLNDFIKSINKGKDGCDIFEIILPQLLEYSLDLQLRTYIKTLVMDHKDYAICNLCLTEREWIFIAIACVVLALCINNILLPRLRRERMRIHNPISEALKLPH